MSFTIDFYECEKGRIHVILQGNAKGEATFGDFHQFIQFVEACQELIKKRMPPIPESFLDAFKQGEGK